MGVKRAGFVNTEELEIKDVDHAVELAKKECTVAYDTISVDYDAEAKVYRVCFGKENVPGGNQDVYINQQGVTELIVYGE